MLGLVHSVKLTNWSFLELLMLVVSYHNNYNVAKLYFLVIITILVRKSTSDIYSLLLLCIGTRY